MRAAKDGDPFAFAFGIVLREQNSEIGGCSYKGPPVDGVRLVCAHTLPESPASQGVLTKCGFKFAGERVDPEDGPVWRFERAV